MKTIILLFFLCLFSVQASACMCIPDNKPIDKNLFENYDYIARATLIGEDSLSFIFKTEERFKGNIPDTIINYKAFSCGMYMNTNLLDDGSSYEEADFLLFYNKEDFWQENLYLTQCSRSKSITILPDSTLNRLSEKYYTNYPKAFYDKSELEFLRLCSQNVQLKAVNEHLRNQNLVLQKDKIRFRYLLSIVLAILILFGVFVFLRSKLG